jgi:hypothetical protein
MARPISETTTFILSLPTALPAREVLAKAKARGIKTSENNVHRVRRIHGRSKQAIAKAQMAKAQVGGAPSSTPKAPAPSAGAVPVPTKSAFVRGFPLDTSAKQIVEKAAAAGIALDVRYVHKVQSRSKPVATKKLPVKTAAAAKRVKAPASLPKSVAVPHVARASSSVEALLRAVAAEIGLGRAVEILQGERASVRAVLGR